MVAKIINGKSIRGMLHYNENKVSEDKAHLIMANGFGADIENLIFHNKLQRFDNLTMLNEKVKTNALHMDIPEPLTTSFRNSEQFVLKHFDHVNSLIINRHYLKVITQIGALHPTESPGQAFRNIQPLCLSILSIIILQHLQHPYNCKSFS
jgi:hypothetical protein